MINRMVIYSKGKKLTDYRPKHQPLRRNRNGVQEPDAEPNAIERVEDSRCFF